MTTSRHSRRQQTGDNATRARRRWAALACAVTIGALGITACGGSDEPASSSANTPAPSSTSQTSTTASDSAAAAVIPKEKSKAPSDKKVAILSCAQASNCALDANGASQAAKALGWQAKIFDGKGDAALFNSSIRSAVNAGYDAIIDIAVPPTTASDGLRYAKQKNVPVIHVGGVPDDTGNPLLSAVQPLPWTAQGTDLGKWLVKDSGGKAKALIIRDDEFAGIKLRQDAVASELKNCPGCKVLGETRESIGNLTNPTAVSQLIQSSLARYGKDLQYIVLPFGTVDGLVSPVLTAQGRTDVKLASYDGNEQQMDLCRQNKVQAIAASVETWQGWAAVDKLIRVLNKQKTGATATPTFLVTAGHCPDARTAEESQKFDYRTAYTNLWK